jgi:hypothetical protein
MRRTGPSEVPDRIAPYLDSEREPSEHVTEADALSVSCPVCASVPGVRCRYIQDQYWPYSEPRRLKHRQGSYTQVTHHKRRAEFARLRLARWQRARRAEYLRRTRESGRPDGLPPRVAANLAALRAFDRQEFLRLSSWLAENGHIFTDILRPDGTVRGETYAFG